MNVYLYDEAFDYSQFEYELKDIPCSLSRKKGNCIMRAVRSVPTELANPGQSLEVMFTNRWESGWVVEEVYDDLPASDYRKEVRPSVL